MKAILSFDVEEFDLPLEFGGNLDLVEQIAVSTKGLEWLLPVLKNYEAKSTFYCTAIYALQKEEMVKKMSERHEIASHNYYHSAHKKADLLASKQVLESIIKKQVKGFRMPRMAPVSDADLLEAGYNYDASINPTYLPGRYNYLDISRTVFKRNGLLYFPASVSPNVRIPLFWIAFHHFPLSYFGYLCRKVAQKDGYVHLYFHPWEFTDFHLLQNGANYPFYLKRNNGQKMQERFKKLLDFLKKEGFEFSTTSELLGL